MKGRVLHTLSQRPSLTGSGVTLDALAREAAAGWSQRALIGVPAGDPAWSSEEKIRPKKRRSDFRSRE